MTNVVVSERLHFGARATHAFHLMVWVAEVLGRRSSVGGGGAESGRYGTMEE